MAEIEWAEPPAKAEIKWDEIADALRSRPGQWAKVHSGSKHSNTGHNIRAAKIKAFRPTGAFEARTTRNEGGYDTYARYVGEASS